MRCTCGRPQSQSNRKKPIHTEIGDFSGPQPYASLSFSPDGRQLAGCVINKQWLSRLGQLIGKVRVWELICRAEGSTPAEAHIYTQLPKAAPMNFVILNNDSVLVPAEEEGAIDFSDVAGRENPGENRSGEVRNRENEALD